MKTVTDAFLLAAKAPKTEIVRTVSYKRRYWDETTKTYKWESSWTELASSSIVNFSAINWQLDSEQLNIFKTSNLTIDVDNQENQWRFDNPSGMFSPDSTSPLRFYEPYLMKFKIDAGLILPDGSEETISLFQGVATEFNFNASMMTCQITIEGLETILRNFKSEDIGTVVSDENVGTGDDAEVDFTTLNPGVAIVSSVKLDYIDTVEESDYTVSQLNDSSLGAKITFSTPPANGVEVYVSYIYWPQNLEFSELVEALLDAAGIPDEDQEVEPVVFPNDILNSVIYTTQADWDTGSFSNMKSEPIPNSIVSSMITDISEATEWENSITGWNKYGLNRWISDIISGEQMLVMYGGGYEASLSQIYRNQSRIIGQHSFKFKFLRYSNANFTYCFFKSSPFSNDGIRIKIEAIPQLISCFYNSEVKGFYWTPDLNEHTIDIRKEGLNHVRVYFDTVLKLNFTDNITVGSYLSIEGWCSSEPSSISVLGIWDIYRPLSLISAYWNSPTIDCESIPKSWGVLETILHENLSSITMKTRSSTNGLSWDEWVAISGQKIPQSILKQYLQINADISMDSTKNCNPIIEMISLKFLTSSTPIVLPNLTGKDIYDALETIALFSNYEFGTTPEGKFFFRPKITGNSEIELTQGDSIVSIGSLDSGYSRVYGTIRSTYGAIMKEISGTLDQPDSPSLFLGTRMIQIDGDSSIEISPISDIATGMAKTYFTYFSKRRPRLNIRTKFLPMIDISDVVTLKLMNNEPKTRKWFLGDHSVEMGDDTLQLWGGKEQFLSGDFKVISARYDLQNHACEFGCEEVVT